MKLIECPRDAMQGIKTLIPTEKKIAYINLLLKAGFDTIDFGSFVSPKAIPQLADTSEVLKGLDLSNTPSKLLSIVANTRGAMDACAFDEISYLGFPFSISETFQQRNTNSSIEASLVRVEEIQNLCLKHNKRLVVYISMGFGNPYGDLWHPDIALQWSEKLYRELDVRILALSDTIGVSNEQNIIALFQDLIPAFPEVEFGAHLHTTPDTWEEKVSAAYKAGCRRMDGALKGFGGCPMAADALTGNMATENVISWMERNDLAHGIDPKILNEALQMSASLMNH
ncbi:MAG: hydroxymethylglutaryl-CoA lyase [Flavobacteriales bacterium]|jgi:hydroxymethylglutaryl-CoA lyase|nr:hydroxymethylglutaryl-CoA lyase [Flavobacteriaceae bacterium]MDP4953648.1 hydroxymethylglutaryl-CoA lyase [Flavobacteriales bacterium]